FAAGRPVMEILEHEPIGLEGMDQLLFEWVQQKGDKNADLRLLPPGHGWLLVEFGGESKEDADAQARALMRRLERGPQAPSMKLYDDPSEEERIWKVREGGLGSTAWVPGLPDTWEGWEDSAVPPEHMGDYLHDFARLLDSHGYTTALYGHFGQ